MTGITHEQMIRNITATYVGATDLERETGLRWYEAAHALAASLAHRYGYSVRQMCGVIAVLAQNISWSRNVQLATLAAKDGQASGTYTAVVEKANRILTGEDPAQVISGPKITSFFLNILNRGENDTVTIDRHALSVAMGRTVDDQGERQKLLKRYAEFSAAYIEAAWRLGIAAAKLQAACWEAYRNTLEGRVK